MGTLFKLHFKPEATSTLATAVMDVDKDERFFAIDRKKAEDNKQKWNYSIDGMMKNNASFFNMQRFAEQRWNSKRLLEVQRINQEFFVFIF